MPLTVTATMVGPDPSMHTAASGPTAATAALGRRTSTTRTATFRTATFRTATIHTATRLGQRDKPAQTRVSSSQMTITATTAAPEASFSGALSEPTALTADLGRHLGRHTITFQQHTFTLHILTFQVPPAQTRVISSSPTVTATTAGPDPSILSAASGPTATTATTAESPAPMRRTAACSGLMVLALFRAAFAQENPTSAVILPKRRETARTHAAHGAAQ